MKNREELEKEYQIFVSKISKAGKDFTDAINELSPENLERFKKEMLVILPEGLVSLLRKLNN